MNQPLWAATRIKAQKTVDLPSTQRVQKVSSTPMQRYPTGSTQLKLSTSWSALVSMSWIEDGFRGFLCPLCSNHYVFLKIKAALGAQMLQKLDIIKVFIGNCK